MHVKEMHIAFKQYVYKNNTNANLNFKKEVIDWYLNVAYRSMILTKYSPNKKFGIESFEQSERRKQDLDKLVKYTTITDKVSGVHSNGVYFTLPSDFWFAIEEGVKLSFVDNCDGQSKTVDAEEVKVTTHDRYRKSLINSFKKPNQRRAYRIAADGKHEIITGTDITATNYFVAYIKKPLILINDIADYTKSLYNISSSLGMGDFVTTPEVSEHLHEEIVLQAVALVDGRINHEQVQYDERELLKT